ncbi:hypothetical protein PT282_06205 [Bifidobacterium sp. ESL0763]|uniref:hypothetical protein n=1 Tax=Bifidobacterium sp. ESL0763 TaxID=2983227 RepID=UPI0023F8D8A9|nr:hypothetical protein [Bifidobacterium sp. ESL0763]MDF7664251.1 hypothetical protein [Bifidobacterium sp. ESL0763]
MVQRKWLIKKIRTQARKRGLELTSRQGGNHEVFYLDGKMIPISRHNEIGHLSTQAIKKEVAQKLGKDWMK